MTDLAAALEDVVGGQGLVSGDDVRGRAASSTDPGPNQAMVLVRPQTTEEVSRVMAVCHRFSQPVVIQGGLTGLADGGIARGNEVALSLERMTAMQDIDILDRTLTAEAGVTIERIQERAAGHGLLFPVDWGARGSAMVGGAIATNAGGNSVLRHGMMREQVLGLEAVLSDGTVLSSMNTLVKNNTGYDLKQLFIGSEGTLGIVTRAVFRLQPGPTAYQTALVGLKDFDDVIALLGCLSKGLAGALGAFEVMWQQHYEMIVTEGGHQWVLPRGLPYYVVIEATGTDDKVLANQFEMNLGNAMEAGLAVDAVICASDAQRQAVWAIREDVDTFLRVLHPPIPFDVGVPIANMEAYVAKVFEDMKSQLPHARGTVFGHLGDNNLHFCWTVGSDAPDEKAAVSRIVYDNLVPFRGSVSAEHGIGMAKRDYLDRSRNSQEINWMKRLKRLFDPGNLLNPGRVIDINQPSIHQ